MSVVPDYGRERKGSVLLSRRARRWGMAVIATIILCGWIAYLYADRLYKQHRCYANLHAIGSTLQLYLQEYHNQFPPDLKTFAISQEFDIPALGCPGRPRTAPAMAPAGVWHGYIMIDWSTQPRGSDWKDSEFPLISNYPLIYDAFLDNHEGRGIHVVMIDGTVRWDPQARWLKQFAAQHPNAAIPIPR